MVCEQAGLPPGGWQRKRVDRSAVTAVVLVLPILLAVGADPLVAFLAEEDYEQQRPHLLREIERLAGSPCEILSTYSGHRNERVREHAVRALADAGCRDFASYRPYLDDPSPWVIESILRAAQDQLMPGAVPFLLDRLSDRRRILAGDASWTISESAHRALRVVTCQSFHFDPEGAPRSRQDAITRWRQWYDAHRDEPREAWVEAGLALGREYTGRDYAPAHRREGLELLALIGPPALPALRAAFERGKTHAIVVIAEGVKENAAKILTYFDLDKQRTGFELRATTLGHVVRGAPPSAFDRLLATRLGVDAVKSLSNGETGVLVGYQKNEVTRTPLADIVGRTKPIDTELVELARILAK